MSSDSFIVHVPKKRLWKKINDVLIDKGYRWDGADARKYWKIYGSQSCIHIDHSLQKMTFGAKNYFKRLGNHIFTSKDFLSMYNNTHGFFGAIRLFVLKLFMKFRRKG